MSVNPQTTGSHPIPGSVYLPSALRFRQRTLSRACILSRAFARVRTLRWPGGALVAVALAILVHITAHSIYPEPVARHGLREKTRALTRDHRPSLVVAGDSAFQCAVLPGLLANGLGLPAEQVINMAESACDTPAFVAAYREFHGRFTPEHTVVLNISSFAANDTARKLIGPELLWDLNLHDQIQLAGPARAAASFLSGEQALWRRFLGMFGTTPTGYPSSRFGSRFPGDHFGMWPPHVRQTEMARYQELWYPGLKFDGVRRQRLERDLRWLRARRMNLVLVLMPFHPAYEAALDRTPAGTAERQFRHSVRSLCRQLGVPCLVYDSSWHGDADPDPLFRDPMHLTRAGAELFTARLALDLQPLHRREDPMRPPVSAANAGNL